MQCGKILEFRFNGETGMAFAKMNSHVAAAKSIFSLNGKMLSGRPIKLDWHKDGEE